MQWANTLDVTIEESKLLIIFSKQYIELTLMHCLHHPDIDTEGDELTKPTFL